MTQIAALANDTPRLRLVDLPYAERQLIVVVADQDIEEDPNAWDRFASELTDRTLAMFPIPGIGLFEWGKKSLRARNQLRADGVELLTVSRSEAEGLQFPIGHPRDDVLYVGHPAVPSVYYTMAMFHRKTFEHKFTEATALLRSLGATQISVEHVAGWSTEVSAHLSVPLANMGLQVGASAESAKSATSRLLFQATYTGNSEPSIPDGLVWYQYEPTWQEIAEGRLSFGLRNFSLSVRYEDNWGINARLRAAVLKAGLDLGGKFEAHQSTVWRIAGEFGKRPNPNLLEDFTFPKPPSWPTSITFPNPVNWKLFGRSVESSSGGDKDV